EARVRADRLVQQCQQAALGIAAVLGRAPAGHAAGVTLGCSRPFGWGRRGATCAMFALPRCSEVNEGGKPPLPDLPRPVLRGAIPSLPAEPIMSFDLFKAFVLGVV